MPSYDAQQLFERPEITPSIAYHLFSEDQVNLKAKQLPSLKQVKGTKDALEIQVLVQSSKSAKLLIKDVSSCEERELSLQQTVVSTTEINKSKANNVSSEGKQQHISSDSSDDDESNDMKSQQEEEV